MRRSAHLAAVLLLLTTAAGCAGFRLEKRLDPDSRTFLSEVRYIITAKERRILRNLPASEREAFIAEFWAKRDPDPATEENEFKTQYYQRIEEANQLFNEGRGSEPGWLQDRGRIYILLGPPDSRAQFPRGMTFYGVPAEVWLYGWFPIYFYDDNWNGNYRLEPDSAIQLAAILKTQLMLKPEVANPVAALDFRLDARVEAGGSAVRVLVPYRKIWFKEEDGRLRASLTAQVTVYDGRQAKIGEAEAEKALDLAAEELVKLGRADLEIEIPLSLPAGKGMLEVILTNSGDGSKVSKRTPFRGFPQASQK
jgi:GWxTD domain-containing protein